MKIQLAINDDIPEILKMMADLNSMYGGSFNKAQNRQNLVNFLNNSELGRLWIIFAEGEAAGYAVLAFGFSFEYGGRDAFIDELYLKEKFRGKGFGSRIMSLIETEAKGLGVKTLHLEVDEENEHGKRLYSKSGFSNNGRLLLNKRISSS
jgi:GNAT superfamily N-acetyltransferase